MCLPTWVLPTVSSSTVALVLVWVFFQSILSCLYCLMTVFHQWDFSTDAWQQKGCGFESIGRPWVTIHRKAISHPLIWEAFCQKAPSRDILTSYIHLQVKMKGEDITFALKVIKKKHVVDNRQEEHIHSERKILAEARSPFVVKSVLLLLLTFSSLTRRISAPLAAGGKQRSAYWLVMRSQWWPRDGHSFTAGQNGSEILRHPLRKYSYFWWNMQQELFLCLLWDYDDPI